MTLAPWQLPTTIGRIGTPPLKSQGIKTKLVPFIAESIAWDPASKGRWVEPFIGTGSVALNLAPPRALLTDINPHVIGVLKAIQDKRITSASVYETLTHMGICLKDAGADFYYEVRERFNESGDPMDFLFLNRASFNGIIRFNKKGAFNTPFGHKPERFAGAFLTKVANQVDWTYSRMAGKDWTIEVRDWRHSVAEATSEDFLYLDPPYIGRHADYFSQWDDQDALALAETVQAGPAGYALSMWDENVYRKNDHLDEWQGNVTRRAEHFYHVGASESMRKPMTEALVIRPGYEADDRGVFIAGRSLKDRTAEPALF